MFRAFVLMIGTSIVFVSGVVFPAKSSWAAEPEEKKITFDEHIKPIFREHCTACHSESDKESDLALDTYAAALNGGSSGEVIAEGNPSSSRLLALMTHAERPFMPPDQDPIPKEQIDLVKIWIEQGMPENSGSKIKRSNQAAAAMLGNVSLGKPDGPPPMPEKVLRQPVLETPRSSAISAMAASPWAPLIAVGGQEQVSLYHSAGGQLLGVLPFPEGEPQSLTFTRDGKQLLIAGGRHSKSGCAVLVDIATGSRITKVGDELDTVLAADITPDKSRIAIAGPQKIVRIYDSVSGDLVVEMKKHTDWIFSLRYSPDGVLLASGDRSNGLVIWEADTGRLYSELSGHKGAVRGLDFRADSNVLASGSLDGTIKLWDMFESREVKSWNAHGGGVTAVAFAQNGLLASSGRDANIKLWNGNGELQKEFKGLGESALEVAITGDAAFIAGGDWNGKVQLWAAETPQKATLIAANPPSIESRLAAATATLEAVQAEWDQALQAANTASAAKTDAQGKLATAGQAATVVKNKLTEAESQQQKLSTELGTFDAKIQELEQQLAAARMARQDVAGRHQKTQEQVGQLKGQVESTGAALAAAEKRHQQLTAASETAEKKRQEVELKLAAAKSAADQAAADKAALDARSKALAERTTQTAAKAEELAGQLAAQLTEQQTQMAQTEKLTQDLNALKEQLAQLQKQVEGAIAAQSQATQQLEAKRQATEQLQRDLESARQAAAEAQEQFELFQQSYQRPE